MIVLGLLILLLVVAVVVAAIVRGDEAATLDLEWLDIETNVTGVFLTGAVSVLLAVIGLWLLLKGAKRTRRRRSEMHSLRDRARAAEEARRRDDAPKESNDRATPSTRREQDADDYFDSTPRENG